MKTDKNIQDIDAIGDDHVGSSADTPIRSDAFKLTPDEKIDIIKDDVRHIMETLGLDLNDDSLKGTPLRVAKMFVKEIFYGLDPEQKPKVSVFDNTYQYGKFILEKEISVKSTCEHHFLPIIGRAHVAYISNGKIIGLSKINRIVDYFARRPQVQERLTRQILEELKADLDTEDVIVMIDASHCCVTTRGIQDSDSMTVTLDYSGKFEEYEARKEFMDAVRND